MSDDIEAGGATTASAPISGGDQRKVVPMKVGNATVYVIQTEDVSIVAEDNDEGEIYTVAPDMREVFDKAIDAIRECVGKIGERIETLTEKAMPQELTVEFSLTFDAKAKGAIIPIFVTTEQGLQTGLKVSAVWKRGDMKPNDKSSPSAKKPKRD